MNIYITIEFFFYILQCNRWCNQFLTRPDSQFAEKGNDPPQW